MGQVMTWKQKSLVENFYPRKLTWKWFKNIPLTTNSRYIYTSSFKKKTLFNLPPLNTNMSHENQWLVQMYSLLKSRPFLGDEFVRFRGYVLRWDL